ncbi:MAG: hypothetical protein ACO20I_15495, partial [bacterium]
SEACPCLMADNTLLCLLDDRICKAYDNLCKNCSAEQVTAWLRNLVALANQFPSIAFCGIIISCLLRLILQNRLTRVG